MLVDKNRLITGANGKPIVLDVFCKKETARAVVIYMHGFNGFKDWANLDLVAQQFADAGFCFLKFNASHNGTTPEHPEAFFDLEAYGNNNYSKELYDLNAVISFALSNGYPCAPLINNNQVLLLGHSRGGGVVLLQAANDERVKGVATWASVNESTTPWGKWPQERLDQWKETGVDFYVNTRTGQKLPLYYQLYQDYLDNKERLDIMAAVSRLQKPLLICHGTQDEAVPPSAAYQLFNAATNASLFLLPSDHVFKRKHPWVEDHLPADTQRVVDATISFFRQIA
jgi:dienelactone hydrolase